MTAVLAVLFFLLVKGVKHLAYWFVVIRQRMGRGRLIRNVIATGNHEWMQPLARDLGPVPAMQNRQSARAPAYRRSSPAWLVMATKHVPSQTHGDIYVDVGLLAFQFEKLKINK